MSPTETGSSPSDKGTSSSRLTTGAKAGIGAGVSVIGVAIIAALALLFFRQRKRHLGEKNGDAAEAPITPATPTVSELGTRAARPWSLRSELDSSQTSPPLVGEMMGDGGGSDKHASLQPSSAGTTPRVGQNASGGNSPLSPVAELPG